MRRHSGPLQILPLSLILTGSCAPAPRVGPYAPVVEAERSTRRAEELAAAAVERMDTNPAEAERLLREALTADLFCGAAHNNLGVIYLNRGKLYEAAHEFEWARKLLPGHPDPRLNLGLALERGGKVADALAAYQSAIEVFPGHIPSIQGLARLQLGSGRATEETAAMLEEITLRGESPAWREWARAQRIKLE